MADELFLKAWDSLYGTAPPDEMDGSPLGGLPDLLMPGPVVLETEHRIGDLSGLPEDPWPPMLVGPERDSAMTAWIFRAARLLPLGRGPSEEWIVVDLETDLDGRHRTYLLDPDGKGPALLFVALDDLFRWLAAPSALVPIRGDRWSADPTSLEKSLPLIWQLHPALLYTAFCEGGWPKDRMDDPLVEKDRPGWKRAAIIWTLTRYRRRREVDAPPGVEITDLTPTHQVLLEHLRDLSEALEANEIPEFVADLTLDEDEEIAEAALEWMARFDQVRLEPRSPTAELAEETQGIMKVLAQALEELVRLEHVELVEDRGPKLVEDLLEVTLKAPRPDMVIPRLIERLLESKSVEEVYATDHELHQVFSSVLGMK